MYSDPSTCHWGNISLGNPITKINPTFPVLGEMMSLVIKVGGIYTILENLWWMGFLLSISEHTLYKSVQPTNRKIASWYLTTPVAIGLYGSFSRWCGHANHLRGRYRLKGERHVDMDDFLRMMDDGRLWSSICIRMMLCKKLLDKKANKTCESKRKEELSNLLDLNINWQFNSYQ